MNRLETYLAISDRERLLDPCERAKPTQAVAMGGAREGAGILDAGSGQGWHALALTPAFSVLGVDASPDLVAEAKRRAGIGAAKPAFRCTRLERLRLPEDAFDLAFSLNSSLGYGTTADDVSALEGIAAGLRPGATLVIEAMSATAAEAAQPRTRRLADLRVTTHPFFDSSTRRISEVQTAVLDDGRRGTFTYAVRAYDPAELEQLARDVGLTRISIAGGLDGRQWRERDPVVLAARRPV